MRAAMRRAHSHRNARPARARTCSRRPQRGRGPPRVQCFAKDAERRGAADVGGSRRGVGGRKRRAVQRHGGVWA